MDYRDFTPKEEKWLDEFEAIMKKAPSTLFMFVGAGIAIYPKKPGGGRYVTQGGAMDQEATSRGIMTKMDCDGGDY